jgi:hypothetical protein
MSEIAIFDVSTAIGKIAGKQQGANLSRSSLGKEATFRVNG